MPEQVTQEQTVEVTTQVVEDYGMQLPEYVVRRLARFLLPKIQEELYERSDLCSLLVRSAAGRIH